ncbi:hypothetical protein B0H63DRAFT_206467 [Podospora didyma]|uniref:Uncharacterized protein n=1 Tax=Podospora didyma TaxID=330526 RepID=A0AAE0NHD1_9PEZI|nr:hypothetical protein B0H63DRAFT_206467 [Podospora didyma]
MSLMVSLDASDLVPILLVLLVACQRSRQFLRNTTPDRCGCRLVNPLLCSILCCSAVGGGMCLIHRAARRFQSPTLSAHRAIAIPETRFPPLHQDPGTGSRALFDCGLTAAPGPNRPLGLLASRRLVLAPAFAGFSFFYDEIMKERPQAIQPANLHLPRPVCVCSEFVHGGGHIP